MKVKVKNKEVSETIYEISTVSEEGEIKVPKIIKEFIRIKHGDKIIFIIEENRVVIKKKEDVQLSKILKSQKAWKENSIQFQKRIRKE
ncbi:MAG: type II toxin-antitoxin system PrlF family antitoxin [Methanosarcinaceae archaeon]|nr:type II toxin-antitoxin system PrlF family antitoxin [Methanosarcinaceae archaeon]NKQ38470.1 hypothetical protein [Methanosarcinales archaeon]